MKKKRNISITSFLITGNQPGSESGTENRAGSVMEPEPSPVPVYPPVPSINKLSSSQIGVLPPLLQLLSG